MNNIDNVNEPILICTNTKKDTDLYTTHKLVKLLTKYFFNDMSGEVLDMIDLISVTHNDTLKKHYKMAFAVGGDGTFLRLGHLMKDENTPIIGINMGRCGFLAEIEMQDLELCVEKLAKSEYTCQDYDFLIGNVCMSNKCKGERVIRKAAINDIIVNKINPLQAVELTLYVDNQLVDTYICDGIVISSALGSTAYNRVLTGVVVHPKSPVMLITPIGSNNTVFKSLVVHRDSVIKIECSDRDKNNVIVGFDGEQESIKMTEGSIVIENNDTMGKLSVIHLNDNKSSSDNYFNNLKRKLRD